jgi:hypothetical protein
MTNVSQAVCFKYAIAQRYFLMTGGIHFKTHDFHKLMITSQIHR